MTTAASEQLAAVHDRMPVVIAPADQERWLSSPDPTALLVPWAGEPFALIPVGTRVNNVANDDATLVPPIPNAEVRR